MMKINETGFDTRSNSIVYGDELCRSLYHDDEELEDFFDSASLDDDWEY